MPLSVFFKDVRCVLKMDELGLEILRIALPAALALAADPIASLIDTAFIGHIGPVEVAAVGVSIAIFNQASRVTIFPLVSITTSFVAEEDATVRIRPQHSHSENQEKQLHEEKNIEVGDEALESLENGSSSAAKDGTQQDSLPQTNVNDIEMKSCTNQSVSAANNSKTGNGKRQIPSASTAIIIGLFLGLFQAFFLIFGAKILLSFMGIKSDSAMLKPAQKYLTLRSLGSPAVLLSLAMQGIFRGFKDTKTPLYATVVADVSNVILDPILIFVCRLGVSGAAIAHVISQYLMTFILLWRLIRKVDLLPPSMKAMQFKRFLKNGLPLLGRVVAATFCVTLAASMAARLGSTPMAAFQICLQVWMTSSLLADGLAVAGQALLATAFAEKNFEKATAAAARVLQMGFVLGLGLAILVGVGLQLGDRIFSKDIEVLQLIKLGIPFAAATQPMNTLAFVFDGVNFGASDFAYAAYSMILVAVVSIACLVALSKSNGFIGIWVALTIYMALRMFAGIWRMGTGTGPWRFLRSRTNL